MTTAEMSNLLIFLFVAGFDTSKNVLTMIMYELIKRPEIYARCKEDPAYCRNVVEEGLRYQSPATIPRLAREDLSYREVRIPKSTLLFFLSAWRPATLQRFRIRTISTPSARKPIGIWPSVAESTCASASSSHVLRIEEGLRLIARRLTNPKLVGKIGHQSLPGVWGLRGLPIEFTPAPPSESAAHRGKSLIRTTELTDWRRACRRQRKARTARLAVLASWKTSTVTGCASRKVSSATTPPEL